MWSYGYTQQWLSKLIENMEKKGIDINKTYFALIIFEPLQHEISKFIYEFYSDINYSSSIPIQIFAPIKPPKSITGKDDFDSFGPENPLENYEEKEMFFAELKKKNISKYPLPKIIFFNILARIINNIR
jgi:hypothetical protein